MLLLWNTIASAKEQLAFLKWYSDTFGFWCHLKVPFVRHSIMLVFLICCWSVNLGRYYLNYFSISAVKLKMRVISSNTSKCHVCFYLQFRKLSSFLTYKIWKLRHKPKSFILTLRSGRTMIPFLQTQPYALHASTSK